MSNKQQTAVEQLVSFILKHDKSFLEFYKSEIEQAKEMEKDQMINFADDFWFHCVNKDGSIKITPEQYYNETYGGN